jgi:Leucine-rich repeat (LRR) protein
MKKKNSTVLIPDANFLGALKERGIVSIDENKGIKLINARSIHELALNDLGIKDLKGIEYFPNLRVLSIYNNKIKELNLNHNTKLEIVHAIANQLTYLNISNLKKLKVLYVSHNNIDKIVLSESLFHLDIRFNKLTSFLPASYPTLKVLLLGGNKIKSLDLTKNDLIYLCIDRSLQKNIKYKKELKAEIYITTNKYMNYDDWLIDEIREKLDDLHISFRGYMLKYHLKKYDPKKLYHQYSKGKLTISGPIIFSSGLITFYEYVVDASELMYIEKTDLGYSAEISLLKLPSDGYPHHIVFSNGIDNEIRFHMTKAEFTINESLMMSDLTGLIYEELTKRENKKLFLLIND